MTLRRGEIEIACLLPAEALEQRARDSSRRVFGQALEKREIDGGYAYRFEASESLGRELLGFALSERECCPFLTIEVRFDPGLGPIWLRLSGPAGTKEFLDQFAAARAAKEEDKP